MLVKIYTAVCSVLWDAFGAMGIGGAVNFDAAAITFGAVYAAGYLAIYLFVAFALYTMAKRREIKSAAIAFVPIVNLILLDKLIGEVSFFGLKIKHMGVIALVTAVVMLAVNVASDIVYIPLFKDMSGTVFTPEGAEYANEVYGKTLMYFIMEVLSYAFERLGLLIFLFIEYYLFRCYAPRSAFLFAALAFLFPLVGAIILFVIRKNSSDEYRNFMKMKMHAMYGGGNPYQYDDGTYRDPYSVGGEKKEGEDKPDSPFGEYDDKK